MDPRFMDNAFHLRNQTLASLSQDSNLNLNGPGFEILHHHHHHHHNLDQIPVNPPEPVQGGPFQSCPTNLSSTTTSNSLTSTCSLAIEDDLNEDVDFSDAVLSYIAQMLMEEDMEDKTYMLQESLDLQAKEKSFYDALGKKYPPSPEPNHPTSALDQCKLTNSSSSNIGGSYISDPDLPEFSPNPPPVGCSLAHTASNSSVGSSSDVNNLISAFFDPPSETESIWNFIKGVEEAKKFLPEGNQLLNVNVDALLPPEPTEDIDLREKGNSSTTTTGLRGRKNPPGEDTLDLEERNSKLAALYFESTIRSEEFDVVLLHSKGKGQTVLAALREELKTAKSKPVHQNGQVRETPVRKVRGKKQRAKKKEVIDLRTLLIHCAQAVAADDNKNARELLKQIREHSFPYGDGNQRLAHCFADGLEARIAGTGSQIYKALVNKRTSASDFLKAYHLYMASSPFRKISTFVSNVTIRVKSMNAMRLHIIDFGILYGFQWPTFMQRIADRVGGPPFLRITGIEFPQPGFRPAEQVEETGHRLSEYAKMFNVPFEYNAIAKKWETIKLEDLKIKEGEFVVVNCLYRSKNLLDETLAVQSSRTTVLNLIRNINPDIFIHGIVNGAYSAPFFVTRFREALFHFSALFDMLESVVPREIPERTLIEKEIFGREALNVIACEGWERVERPETYKQWQLRDLRAGFRQIPFERDIMKRAREKVTTSYHKDFVIDEDSQWLLLGWKGRIIYALSCWTPV
ncbi:OLC1v1006510C1 [Oldenlandia corymbosa var. corymbosa]|uniref:OLC1v1006510C1 n=1 Tax=Oldenlandia corymbosa var. corymbosa TaxID=529605 RepID=A0AAV1DJM6_OLDCO|nr:OLC1v1006510C1 [Oldenlandia corymbosa var. corymbosa]